MCDKNDCPKFDINLQDCSIPIGLRDLSYCNKKRKDDPIVHKLKTWPPYFISVWSGLKTFEVRYNDRKFQELDYLLLKEFDPHKNEYTGRTILCRVTYLLKDEKFVKQNFVIMAIRIIKKDGPCKYLDENNNCSNDDIESLECLETSNKKCEEKKIIGCD